MGGHDVGPQPLVRGIITHKIAANEQKPMAEYFSRGIPNTYRRVRKHFLRIGVPLLIVGYIINESNNVNYRVNRKDPKEFENDV